jgi:GNAT superfamily N-acetyltransferase
MSIVVLDSSAEESAVQRVLDVSNEIFEIDVTIEPKDPPTCIKEWMMRLNMNRGEIIYHTDDSGNPVAFMFIFQRSSNHQQLHIWIAGCQREYRRHGLMAKLFAFAEERKANQGIRSLTVNTYPSKFVNMPMFLTSRQFEHVETTPTSDAHPELGEKWSYIKHLSKQ